VIGWGDYADGIAARVTRQYSRLGALMDPVTDRLLVVSGVVVTWHFDLLPRWALAVLAVRELLDARDRALCSQPGRRAAHQLARAPGRGARDGVVLLRHVRARRRRRR
jgi:phosphatidylglycerophosphate synthase